jgi:CheY-like chemotaxis protein
MRILVADDMPMQVHALETYVRQALPDADVRAARDGQAILDIAGETRPDLILSDIRMPRLDGLEMLERLK